MHSRFDTESRIAVAQATDIARELGHQEVGPDHLLLGLLANPRGTAYAALWDHGVNLETARNLVHVENHLVLLGRKDSSEKVAAFLFEMHLRSTQADIIHLPMTRRDIADYLGLNLETVSRALSALRRKSILRIDVKRPREAVVLNAKALADLAEERPPT